MKRSTLLSVFLVFASTIVMSQTNYPPTPEYDYAILRIIDEENSFAVEYSNNKGIQINLKDILKINRKSETLSDVKFRCFNYLNSQGYELVSSTCFSYAEYNLLNVALPKEQLEYIFKRLKQVSDNK